MHAQCFLCWSHQDKSNPQFYLLKWSFSFIGRRISQTIQMMFTIRSSERLCQIHLPHKGLLAEYGNKQRGECKQPLHHDQERETDGAGRRLLWLAVPGHMPKTQPWLRGKRCGSSWCLSHAKVEIADQE